MKGQQAIGTLVIFIALVITAAMASFVLVNTANALQSKSLAVSQKTMEKATMGFTARQVEGIASGDGQIDKIMLGIELAPGSDTIDLSDATLIWTANGGTEYVSYTRETNTVKIDTNEVNWNIFTYSDFNNTEYGTDPNTSKIDGFVIIKDRSDYTDETDPDRYIESGELYVIGFKLSTPLDEGEDWKIILRAPYTQDLIVTGYAPSVIQEDQIITLKSA